MLEGFYVPVLHVSLVGAAPSEPPCFVPRTVAGTRLRRARNPPRQALCLRMAYGVPYPNPLSLPYFLMISFPNILILPDNPGVGSACPPPGPGRSRTQRFPWIFEPQGLQDASKSPREASKSLRTAQMCFKSSTTRFSSNFGSESLGPQKSLKFFVLRASCVVSPF